MTVYEYLSEKYGVAVPSTMTHWEAQIFKIGQLKSGWLARHGATVITPDMFSQIKRKLLERRDRQRINITSGGEKDIRLICHTEVALRIIDRETSKR